MNNFVMTNIEVDSISFNANDFKITLFKNYFGKVFSALTLKSNLPGTYILTDLGSRSWMETKDSFTKTILRTSGIYFRTK